MTYAHTKMEIEVLEGDEYVEKTVEIEFTYGFEYGYDDRRRLEVEVVDSSIPLDADGWERAEQAAYEAACEMVSY